MRARDRVLGLLAVADRPLSAYDICSITRTGPWRIYRLLRELETEGTIGSHWVGTGNPKAPNRRLYHNDG